jgi:hypothetical protein
VTDQHEQRLARLEQILATTVQRVYALEMWNGQGAASAAHAPRPAAMPAGMPRPAEAPEERGDLEAKLGTYWLPRIGIVSLITGAALLVVTYFAELGPAVRVLAGYAMAAAVAGVGHAIARKHQTFGRVVIAGGLAIGYFVTYALHFVPAMRVIDSDALGVALAAAAVAAIVAIAHRMKSETVAGVALFLGLHTGAFTDASDLSLACTTLLAAGAGFFIAANRWVIVPISTVIAVYTTHAMLAVGVHGAAVEPSVLVTFLALDFALFAAALLVRVDLPTATQEGIAILNWFGALAIGSFALRDDGADTVFACVATLAVVHAGLAAVARARRAQPTFVATLLALAVTTMALALPLELHRSELLAGWLVLAIAAVAISRVSSWSSFGVLGVAIAAAANLLAHWELSDGARLACVLVWLVIERVLAYAPVRLEAALTPPVQSPPAPTTSGLVIACAAISMGDFAVAAMPDHFAIAGVLVACVLFGIGFATRVATYRWAAFAALAVTALRFVTDELPGMSAGERIATFVVAGAALLGVSYVYTRRRA